MKKLYLSCACGTEGLLVEKDEDFIYISPFSSIYRLSLLDRFKNLFRSIPVEILLDQENKEKLIQFLNEKE